MKEWMNELLQIAENKPDIDAVSLLQCCGVGCARRQGAFEGIVNLQKAAEGCKTLTDYAGFFRNSLHIDAREDEEGIILRLNKRHCTCPLSKDISSGMLCHCTEGHEVAVWSKFFGKKVDVEILESHLRGGNDCVIKIIV